MIHIFINGREMYYGSQYTIKDVLEIAERESNKNNKPAIQENTQDDEEILP